MIYQIVIIEPNGKRICEEGYSTLRSAEKKILKTYSKKQAKIIPLPDTYNIGLKIYIADGSLYGEIVRESESFWYIQKVGKEEESMFLKANMEDKFIKEVFIYKEEIVDIEEEGEV